MCMSGGAPSSSCIPSPSSAVTLPSSAAGAPDHSELIVPVTTVTTSSSVMPTTDQTVLLQPTSSCDTPAADQHSECLVPTSTATATDHSELQLAVPMTTDAPSSAHFPASHHHNNLHPIIPKSGKQRVHVLDISPYPTCKQAERRQKKSQKAEVLTSTPYKTALEEKSIQSKPKSLRRKRQGPGTSVKRKLPLEVPHHVAPECDADVYECIYCGDKFVDPPPEPWVQCSVCLNWCHEACVLHMKPPFPANFACAKCQPKRRRR